jgi:hypothetical protein
VNAVCSVAGCSLSRASHSAVRLQRVANQTCKLPVKDVVCTKPDAGPKAASVMMAEVRIVQLQARQKLLCCCMRTERFFWGAPMQEFACSAVDQQ